MSIRIKLNILIASIFLSFIISLLIFLLVSNPIRMINAEKESLFDLSDSLHEFLIESNKATVYPIRKQREKIKTSMENISAKFSDIDNLKALRKSSKDIQVSLQKIKSQQQYISIEVDTFLSELNTILEDAAQVIPGDNIQIVDIYKYLSTTTAGGKTIKNLEYNLNMMHSEIQTLNDRVGSSLSTLNEQFSNIEREAAKLQKSSLAIALITSLLVVAIGVLFSYFLSTHIEKALRHIQGNIHELSKGNLNILFNVHRRDDLGRLADQLNAFLGTMISVINQIKNVSKENMNIKNNLVGIVHHSSSALEEMDAGLSSIKTQISTLDEKINISSTSSENINTSVKGMDNQVIEQSSMVEETSSAVTQMISSIDNVAKITHSKRETTDKLVQIARTGGEKLAETVKIIESINENLDNVGNVTKVIIGIAAQTNLLALNAAIEAAHAGDAGKGFSVVAQEIRKLAEAVNAQSKQIKTDIQSIISMIRDAVMQSNSTLESFHTINSEIEGVDKSLAEITDTMRELNAGGRQIIEAITSLRDITVKVTEESRIITMNSDESYASLKTVRDISSSVKESINELAMGVSEITRSMETTNELSREMSNTSETLDQEINYFKTE
ncbi:MAG: hypothetical protein JW874_01480 [Spirochaetales bacterium]|nr:hypothetical protein [Spirochaetales bacterium]